MLLNIEAKEINGYKIFDILDDGIYVAKSKEDLMEYVRNYGNVEEVYGVTEQELFDEIEEIPLTSDEVVTAKNWDHDYCKCIYDIYKSIAENDSGTEIILTYNA